LIQKTSCCFHCFRKKGNDYPYACLFGILRQSVVVILCSLTDNLLTTKWQLN